MAIMMIMVMKLNDGVMKENDNDSNDNNVNY